MADLKDLEIARVGTWHLASGPIDITAGMLRDAADYAARPDARPAPLKIGHQDPRFDGEPALGWLHNLRVEGAEDDAVLRGDVSGMPDWLAAMLPTAWPDRSMEGWADYVEGGRTWSLVVDGLALLGVTPPGMSTIRSLRDLPQALGVAASARIVAQMKAPVTEPGAGQQEGAGMSLVSKYREAIAGLPDDASNEDVGRVLAAAGLKISASQEEPPAPPAEPQPVPPAEPGEPVPSETPPETPPKKVEGMVTMDASTYEEMQTSIRRLQAAEDKRRRDERDDVIAAAIRAGKFAPHRREHWARVWDADPEGTRELIAGLTPNQIPVEASGWSGQDDESVDAEFASLFSRKG